MANIKQIKLADNTIYDIVDAGAVRGNSNIFYATCDTPAATSAKVINNLANFQLQTGTTVRIKFTYTNSAANPTLNINNTGAKTLVQYGTTVNWYAGAVVAFTYDGTNWIQDQGFNTDDLCVVRGTGANSALVVNTSSPNTASGIDSFAVGPGVEASGKQSIAMGDRVKANGLGAISIGGKVSGIDATKATSTGAIAIGASCCSSGMYAISIGYMTTASGMAALALGAQNEAQGTASFTAGAAGVAKGNRASTIGYNLIASGNDSLVCGKYNIADETNETANNIYAMIIGNGTSAEARSNAMTVDWAGNVNAQNSLSVANSVSMVYNITTNALDFVFPNE